MKRKFTILTAAFMLLAFLAVPLGMRGQAPVNTVLWAEDFSGYSANAVPSGEITNSHDGTTVYGDVTLTYSCSNGTSNGTTKVYNETSMSSTAPELLIAKSNGTFVISNISTGSAIDLTLTYKENYNRSVLTTTTEGVTISEKTFSSKTSTYTITTNGASSLNLTFTNTNGSNVRVDDFSLKVKTAGSSGGSTDPTVIVSETSLTGFSYIVGSGPSASQYFTVSGSNLGANNLVVTASSNYEVCKTDAGTYTSSVTFTPSEGSVVTSPVYVRLKAGLGAGSYASADDKITVSSTGADSKTVSLSGSVLASYTITCATGLEHGYIEANKSTAVEGETVTITATPDSDYQLSTVTVTNVAASDITIAGNTATFAMPANNVTVSATFEELTEAFYDFHFSVMGDTDWGSSYDEHVVDYPEATVTFASANKQSGTITDIPVTKGNPVSIVMKPGMPNPTGVTFVCRQWGTKAQTITLHYSTDGGNNYTSTGITSSNFTISSAALPTGTNAVKITFSTQDNQVGVQSATLNFSSDPVISVTPTTLSGFAYTEGGGPSSSQTFNVSGNNLTANITVALPSGSDFELSEDESIWTNSITLSKDGAGAVASTPIYARMKSGLDANDYSNDVSVTSGTLSETVTLSGTVSPAPVAVTYNLASTVTPGKHYIIVSTNTSDEYFAMGGQNGDYRNPVNIDVTSNSTTILSNAGVTEIAISGDATNGYTLHATDGYLAGGNKTLKNNGTASSTWTISFSENIATISTGGYAIKYNASSPRFNCYGSGQRDVYLYEKATDKDFEFYSNTTLASATIANDETYTVYSGATLNVTEVFGNNGGASHLIIKDGAQLKTQNAVEGTVEKNITGYSTSEGGYYLIAAPGEIDITGNANNGFLPADHSEVDFYMFDQTQEGEEWQNMKFGHNEITGPLGLTRGTGYLYANKNNTTLVFNTMTWVDMYSHSFNSPFVPTNNNQNISVTYSTNGEKFAGWNLIGNPFTCKAYLADGSDFYRMNADGNGLIINTDAQGGGNAINVCEGIFVETTAAETEVTFTTTDPTVTSIGNNNGMVNISVAQVVNSRDAQPSADYARIRVNNGKDMTKFVFNENTSRVYIPQGNKDYAVVRSEARGEMPVNFKAAENGTYTIDVEAENLEVNYLHLIDNLTGMDVDLLATPSYTFEARKSDIASRFRLVFDANTGNDETNDNFAFINNGELIVNGTGTVQVIDILGRQMFSHEVNSAFRIQNSEFAPGVYVLRLVNGNDVKTQKIVIK